MQEDREHKDMSIQTVITCDICHRTLESGGIGIITDNSTQAVTTYLGVKVDAAIGFLMGEKAKTAPHHVCCKGCMIEFINRIPSIIDLV